ncbi:MAG TPA: transcription elongation factor GreA [Jiangellales bacterium]|nr:transcription elongation factor GreA [Jiangellales bacterium]
MTSTSDNNVAWLTQEAYDTLQAELEQLMGPARTEIAKRIEAARAEGDLSENGGYHAAKEAQGHQEARIRQLQALLQRAKVGEKPADDGVVEPGMVVEIRFSGDDETESFLLGSRELMTLDSTVEIDVYSPRSPLGAAINGHRVGDTATYEAPNGREITVEIVSAHPYAG